MARINLLPWREERRKQRQREFYGMLGFAALSGVVLSGLLWFFFSQQISGQNERNAYLEAEIAKVKEQNKEIDRLDSQKKRLLDRKQVIEELQGKRSQMVHLFDALVRTIPDGVVLTALKQEGETLTLDIDSLDLEANGVAHHEGKVVFVRGALPGERVRATVVRSDSVIDSMTRGPAIPNDLRVSS